MKKLISTVNVYIFLFTQFSVIIQEENYELFFNNYCRVLLKEMYTKFQVGKYIYHI